MTQTTLFSGFRPLPSAPAKSDNARVLEMLREFNGDWVDQPYQRLHVMWHSRVAELRRRGHVIECRRVGNDYQYRLVQGNQ